jgi:hypothetical protein
MSDDPKKRSRGWIGRALLVILIPVLYPLSTGPALWLAYKSGDPENWTRFAKVYKPIGWFRERSTTVKRVVDWYTELWLPTH